MDFVLRSTGKAPGDHGIKLGGKTPLGLDYADVLSILDESVSKINELLEVSQAQGARIGLKINSALQTRNKNKHKSVKLLVCNLFLNFI